jgi:hypothetical protein
VCKERARETYIIFINALAEVVTFRGKKFALVRGREVKRHISVVWNIEVFYIYIYIYI